MEKNFTYFGPTFYLSKFLIFSRYCPFKICYRYINEVVATRKLPLSAKTIKPKVVMKMDIEVRAFINITITLLITMIMHYCQSCCAGGASVFVRVNKGQQLGTWRTINAHENFKGTTTVKNSLQDSEDSNVSTSSSVLKLHFSQIVFFVCYFWYFLFCIQL
jgi:hypothetical protein